MRFDRLPNQCRGAGIRIALVDSGIATGHKQLTKIDRGFDIRDANGQSWSKDLMGHGTPCAGLCNAVAEAPTASGAYAPDSELHVCKLPPEARCSDLIPALDYCLQNSIDVACLGFVRARFGADRAAYRDGKAARRQHHRSRGQLCRGGVVSGLFAACLGGCGGRTDRKLSRRQPAGGPSRSSDPGAGGFFVPLFSCRGPEVDLCAPGVAVIACQSPDAYAICDGTSLAAAHVTALAALILADHGDFKGSFARRDFQRVERLFQILKRPRSRLVIRGRREPDCRMQPGR